MSYLSSLTGVIIGTTIIIIALNMQDECPERVHFFNGNPEERVDSVVWPELSEEIQTPDGVVTKLMLNVRFYDSVSDMEGAVGFKDIDGAANCARNAESNMAWCDIYIPRPRYVDGYNSWTLGHEVLHGVYGTRYHE